MSACLLPQPRILSPPYFFLLFGTTFNDLLSLDDPQYIPLLSASLLKSIQLLPRISTQLTYNDAYAQNEIKFSSEPSSSSFP